MEQLDYSLDGGIDDINLSTVYRMESITDGGDEELPRTFLLNSTPVQDQRKYKYTNGCTRAGGSGWINETNASNNTNGDPLRTYAVEFMKANPKFGSSMSSFLGQARKDGLITGYANISKDNLYLIKKSIYNRKPPYCGSNKIDRVAMVKSKTNIAIISSGPGHIFFFDGWDDNIGGLRARDSFGNLRGDGHFRVKYEDIHSMYTFIVATTPDEHKNLKLVKDEEMKQLVIEKGISNGQELEKEATRGQVAIMIGRLKYGELPIIELLKKTKDDKIWNGVGDSQPVLREDMFLMLARYLDTDLQGLVQKGLTNLSRKENYATREELVILIGRILASKLI